MHKRTGLRKPKNHLKMWGDPTWSRRLTPRLTVGMVDEELPYGREGGRKSWYLSLTQDPDLLETLGPVQGVPTKGKTLLLFEDDIVALVQYIASSELVFVDEAGHAQNGQAVDYEDFIAFKRSKARKDAKRKAKVAQGKAR